MSGIQRSPWVIHYDASSCNGCDIEVLACLTPVYDVERLGVINTGNPKHADIFLVTGAVNEQNVEVVKNIYHQMPEPKVVVAIGICATSGGIFRECYNVCGGVDTVIPVDVYVPGCAARPEVIIDGVVEALGVLEEKRLFMKSMDVGIDQVAIERADADDAPEILALQKVAYQSEAEMYGDDSLPALHQTLADMQKDFETKTFLRAVINGKIIGSVRASADGAGCHISRLIVHPYFQNRGIGTKLVLGIEGSFPSAKRFEVFTGHLSRRNIALYEKVGFRQFKTEKFTDKIQWVYMERTIP